MDIFSDIEQNIGIFFIDLILSNLCSVAVIIFVPLVVSEILDDTDVMPKVQCSIVVNYSVEIISELSNAAIFLQEVLFLSDKGAKIKIVQREFYQSCQLISELLRKLKSFELYN